MKFEATFEVRQNLKITARERGKIVDRREGHNIWLNTGRDRARNLRLYRKAGYRIQQGESRVHPATVDLIKRRRVEKG